MQKTIKIIIALVITLMFTTINVGYNSESLRKLHIPEYKHLSAHSKSEIDCLTKNIYREAGIEKQEGMIAVALVTMNRVKAPGFPETVCKVVQQKKNKTCQFSWNCMEKLPRIDEQIYNYSRSLAITVFFNHETIEDTTQGALFYHANYVRPRWPNLEVTTKIGRHIFYKPIGEA